MTLTCRIHAPHDLRLEDVASPELGAHDAEIRLGAGGICVLAHPGMWGDQTSVPDELIERMAAAGMQGLEVVHTDHDEDKRAYYGKLAERLGLIPTGGSDCHGDRYDPIRLGTSRCDPGSFADLRALAAR